MDSKSFFYSLGKAIYHIDALYDDFAKKSGVAPTLLWILYALNDGEAHTQRDICVDWALPKSTVNTVVTDLKAKNFVELVPVKGKRREMTILLTEKGKKYADSILSDIYQREAEVFNSLKKSDYALPERIEKITCLLTKKEE